MNTHTRGFTLIEVLMVTAIIAILAVVSVSVFTWQIREGRRTDAINSLLSISLAEEHYRSNNSSYGTLAQAWGGVTASAGGYYTLSISNVSATSYTITATAVGDQANDAVNGTVCTPMVLTVSNGAQTQTPAACWPS